MAVTPLLLVENFYDAVMQFPAATITANSQLTGREAFRVADYRRERSWWQAATSASDHELKVDLGSGNTGNPDAIWIDRGHNLWTHAFAIRFSDNGSSWTTHRTLTAPASTVVGGDPSIGGTPSVTEEGALWALFAAEAAPHRYWKIQFVDSMQPIIPGVILGRRVQLLGYSKVFDEDAGERTEMTDMSRAGYRGTDRTYAWRRALLDLGTIDATDYDATIRVLRTQLFVKNVPFFLSMQWDTKPERGWLFQYDGQAWSMAKTGTLRAGQIPCREVGHVLG